MTPEADQNLPVPLRTQIQQQLPGISDEIQGAINTLQKLQEITGATEEAALSGRDADHPPGASARGPRRGFSPGAEQADAEFAAADADQAMGREFPLLAASESFGRYQIVRLLGRGAMGAVYLAYDSQLQRYVALKTPFLKNKPQLIERFYREARAAAQLRSPYICPIYDVGEISGICYYSMAFIEGRSLARVMADGELTDEKAIVAMTKKVARGMQKAHELGIIHRDIKPENIMIDSDGEPILMDFGLAKRVDDETQLTVAGSIFGTPVYMSPEQVHGDPKKIGPGTDIYSLGVMLYQMLTGRLPFQGSLTSVLHQITHDAPAKPSALNADQGRDARLERICLKMMAKTPAERLPSMAAVADALEQLDPEAKPIADKTSLLSRLTSWLKGKPRAHTPTVVAAPAPAASPASSASPGPGRTVRIGSVETDSHPDAGTFELAAGSSMNDPDIHAPTQTIDLPPAKEG